MSKGWENNFSGVLQCTLSRPVLDHSPILLDGVRIMRGSTPFRFENMWVIIISGQDQIIFCCPRSGKVISVWWCIVPYQDLCWIIHLFCWMNIPFRFGNIWLKEEGFKDFLKWWSLWYNLRGSYSFILAVKLKALKSNLKSWNKKVFGNVVVRKDMTFNQVGFQYSKERIGALTQDEVEARR